MEGGSFNSTIDIGFARATETMNSGSAHDFRWSVRLNGWTQRSTGTYVWYSTVPDSLKLSVPGYRPVRAARARFFFQFLVPDSGPLPSFFF